MEFPTVCAIPLPDKVRNTEILCGDSACVDKRGCKLPVATKFDTEKLAPCKVARSLNVIKEGKKLASVKTCASELLIKTDAGSTRVADRRKFNADNEFGTQMNQLVVQAAMGGCRWPPYLLVVWVVLLVVSHALHCIVMLLRQALPHIKQLFVFLRLRTEAAWRCDERKMAAALATSAASVYALYLALYAAYLFVNWFLDPLSMDERAHGSDGECNEDVADNDDVTKLS